MFVCVCASLPKQEPDELQGCDKHRVVAGRTLAPGEESEESDDEGGGFEDGGEGAPLQVQLT